PKRRALLPFVVRKSYDMIVAQPVGDNLAVHLRREKQIHDQRLLIGDAVALRGVDQPFAVRGKMWMRMMSLSAGELARGRPRPIGLLLVEIEIKGPVASLRVGPLPVGGIDDAPSVMRERRKVFLEHIIRDGDQRVAVLQIDVKLSVAS